MQQQACHTCQISIHIKHLKTAYYEVLYVVVSYKILIKQVSFVFQDAPYDRCPIL